VKLSKSALGFCLEEIFLGETETAGQQQADAGLDGCDSGTVCITHRQTPSTILNNWS